MTNEELHKMAEQGPDAFVEALDKLTDVLERFRRGQLVAALFDARTSPGFGDRMRAIGDDGFLRDLENFGSVLKEAATRQRSRLSVRDMGGGYKDGA